MAFAIVWDRHLQSQDCDSKLHPSDYDWMTEWEEGRARHEELLACIDASCPAQSWVIRIFDTLEDARRAMLEWIPAEVMKTRVPDDEADVEMTVNSTDQATPSTFGWRIASPGDDYASTFSIVDGDREILEKRMELAKKWAAIPHTFEEGESPYGRTHTWSIIHDHPDRILGEPGDVEEDYFSPLVLFPAE